MIFRELYLRKRFFLGLILSGGLFLLAYSFSALLLPAQLVFYLLLVFALIELVALFRLKKPVFARRLLPERFSNGEDNEVSVYLENRYPFPVDLEIIDEIPVQFQKRDLLFRVHLESEQSKMIHYSLRPNKRGEYHFGVLNVYASGRMGLVQRRFRLAEPETVKVYPAFQQLRRYELRAISNQLQDPGIKKVRRIGQSMEFEQVRSYVPGDDPRFINWKASARRGHLMLNAYQDERSQQVVSLIDKGRTMQMPFEGLSLMDYAINASLVLAHTALVKGDKAGLLTFSDKIGNVIAPGRQPRQLESILEALYNQRTRYLESNFELLYATVRKNIGQRSLLVLFTNFETLSGMRRQLPYLKGMARHHLLLTVFFENTELKGLLQERPRNTEEIYLKTVAEQLSYEKRLIARELHRQGIHTLLSAPADLSVNTFNKYLELKARNLL